MADRRRPRLAEGDQPSRLLVPQLQPRRAHAVPQRDRGDGLEDGVLVVRALEVVVGDPRVEVVHVVQADVAGEELQRLRELEVGAAAQRRVGERPGLGVLPVGVLELVLDVEEEDARRAAQPHGGHLHEQVLAPADQPAQPADQDQEGDVGEDHAAPDARLHTVPDEARQDDERVDRPDPEHHQRVAEQAVRRRGRATAVRGTPRRSGCARRRRRGGRGRRRSRGAPRGCSASCGRAGRRRSRAARRTTCWRAATAGTRRACSRGT